MRAADEEPPVTADNSSERLNDFRVVAGLSPARVFERPHAVLHARTAGEARKALDDIDRALAAGRWIAGCFSYELGAALAGLPKRGDDTAPLLAIGIFDEPATCDLIPPGEAFRFSPMRAQVTRARYEVALGEIARSIYEGDVYQVNYTLPFAFAFEGDPYAAYVSLAQQTRAPYAAYLADGDRAVLSFSPELFLAFDGDCVTTKPMKGTAALDRIDDLDSEKNRAEHVMIVDLLRNDLHRTCGQVRVDQLFDIERYPTFATMTSTISGEIAPDTTFSEILGSAFPCGSVTGAPKRAAMRSIARLESFARGAYCGSIGFLGPDRRGWWNVAIRTAQIDSANGVGRFDAGGGIVSDSRAGDEWSEVLLKTQFFRSAIGPFEILEAFAGGDASARDEHLARMRKTAAAFDVPWNAPSADAELARLGDMRDRLVRLRLRDDGIFVASAEPLHASLEPVPICISDVRVFSGDPMLVWKTSWRPAHERAAGRARDAGCFDALLTNERGEITEGARTTVFAQMGTILCTPPAHSGVLPGILRQRMVSQGMVSERTLLPGDLRRADALYVGNSARGLMRATLIEAP
jgi:para-aminobenzoate synthetase/4-amino-4-deoxychorismate lyase